MRSLYRLIILVILAVLTGCSQHDIKETESMATSVEATVSHPSDTVADSTCNKWSCVANGVFDISQLYKRANTWAIVNILLEERIIVYSNGNQLKFVQFDLEDLTQQWDSAIDTMEFGGTPYCVSKSYLLFSGRHQYDPVPSVRVYDRISNTLTAKWELREVSAAGTTYIEDAMLIVDTEDHEQRIYIKNMENGREKNILLWENPDRTKKPIFTSLNQGQNGFAYVGMIYPAPGEQSIQCYGLVDNTGNIAALIRREQFAVAEYCGGIVIYDTVPAYGTVGDLTGRFVVLDANSMTVSEVIPETSEEGLARRIYVSDNGRYILTSTKNGWFRVYDTNSGDLVARYKDEWTPENITQYLISISEKDHAFVVWYRTNAEPAIYYFQFE